MYLGNGTEYTNLSHTEASLFLTLPANAYEISFDASIKTEALLDFMKIVIVSEGKEIPSDKFSGDMPMNNYKIDLSQYAGKPIEIRFVFESDAATLDKGILIKNILLTPVL